jgi:hypothetical protein
MIVMIVTLYYSASCVLRLLSTESYLIPLQLCVSSHETALSEANVNEFGAFGPAQDEPNKTP